MRITTAFNRLLRLRGASVIDVAITAEAIIVTVRLRRRRRICSRCGQTGRQLQIHGRRVKRWRHLDLASTRCVIECELRRLRCPACGIHLEPVAWARPDAQHTRDFENVVAWLAQQMAKTQITRLLRIGWATVGQIVTRVVADQLDERRLSGLVAIGCDEISYRRGQRYLTSVVDHDRGAIVWCAAGRNAETLQRFFDELGDRKQSIRAISIDMAGGYAKAIRDSIPDAEICFDPFHVVRLAQRAVDQVRRDEWNAHDRSHTKTGKWIKNTRWSLLKSPDKQSVRQLAHASARGRATPATQKHARCLVSEAIKLVGWLHDQQLQLCDLRQDLVDTWIAGGVSTRRRVRMFLQWLARADVTGELHVAWTARGHGLAPLDDEHRFAAVRRLLHDSGVDPRDRLAGCLLLLYAQPLTRTAALLTSDIAATADGQITITLARGPIALPEPLGSIVHALHTQRVADSGVEDWLLPGRKAGSHITAQALRKRLKRYDIASRPGRQGALLALAARLPAPILAERLGFHPARAAQWVRAAGATYADYVALRSP